MQMLTIENSVTAGIICITIIAFMTNLWPKLSFKVICTCCTSHVRCQKRSLGRFKFFKTTSDIQVIDGTDIEVFSMTCLLGNKAGPKLPQESFQGCFRTTDPVKANTGVMLDEPICQALPSNISQSFSWDSMQDLWKSCRMQAFRRNLSWFGEKYWNTSAKNTTIWSRLLTEDL